MRDVKEKTSKGFVYLERKLFYAINNMATNRIISFNDYRIILMFISETVSWKVDANGKPSSKSTAIRKNNCNLSYCDIEQRTGIKGNIARSIKKLKGLGIIRAVKPETNRQKVTYYFETNLTNWNTSITSNNIAGEETNDSSDNMLADLETI